MTSVASGKGKTMSRYIDADALITQDWFVEYIGNLEETQVKDIIQQCKWYVMKAPSVDIVRCQDCKYWVYNFNGCARNPCTEPWYATDFCSYGERREP